MQLRKILYVTFIFLFLVLEFPSSLAQNSDQLELSFRQDFNSYFWRARFNYLAPIDTNQTLMIAESFNSDLLESSLKSDKWKDDQLLSIQYLYRLKSWLTGAAIMRSKIFSDRLTGIQNNTNSHQFGIGWILQPIQKIEIKNYGGWKSDQRFNQTQQGPFIRIESNSLPFQIEEYKNRYSFNFETDYFKNRQNQDYQLNYQITRKFLKNTTDTLNFRTGYHKINYFISENGDLESRIEKETDFTNRLHYQISNRLTWDIYTRLFSRSSEVDQTIEDQPSGKREREDTETKWESNVRWKSAKLNIGFGGSYSSKRQKYKSSETITPTPFIGSVGIPDNRGLTYSLRTFLDWKVSQRDSVSASISLSRFQYDTPDSNNFDDRDELRANFQLTYARKMSPHLMIGFDSKGYLHHLVYLFSERSSNNNWNRILQLGTFLRYSTTNDFKWYQRAEVQANYTAFDFEDTQFLIRSFVYRKFTLTDSLTIGSEGNFQFKLFHRLELEENGRLFWDSFSEQLLLNRRNHQITIGCQYAVIGNLMLYTGISGYLRREWRYRPAPKGIQTKERLKDFTSYGPQIKLFLRNNNKRQALFSLSRQKISTPSGQSYTINRVDLNTHWFF